MVGHHWQEFVTPGSTEQVSATLEILAEIGAAESRFRMPRGDGSLVEFDSYTEVDGEAPHERTVHGQYTETDGAGPEAATEGSYTGVDEPAEAAEGEYTESDYDTP